MSDETDNEESPVHYALLIYTDPHAQDGDTDEEREAVTAEYMAIREDPRVTGGGHLQPVATASTVRVADGTTLVTDGPFADTKEVIGGYYLLEADDLDAALEIAQRVPAARMGGAVEVRPFVFPPH
ncbi:MAG TPA: YciI family protein [Nocardioides sp.]|uniref:YciI family protein n=1 Tax=Nocardioides sp. TaxID=35761 RepID=UPI002E3235CA|nr:YciI family protein [Nocardioides sp.]HEX5087290.1 YciI family protein [Nocardioides sp.]